MFLVQHSKRVLGAGSAPTSHEAVHVMGSAKGSAVSNDLMPTNFLPGSDEGGTPKHNNTLSAVNPLLLTPGRIEPAVFYLLEESAAGVADFFDVPAM